MSLVERFFACWWRLQGFYVTTHVLRQPNVMPSALIWSEADVQLQLGHLCIEEFGREWVHQEATDLPGGGIPDLVVTDPADWRALGDRASDQQAYRAIRYDLAAMIKILPQYWQGAHDDAQKLQDWIGADVIKHGVLCLLDKSGPPPDPSPYRQLRANFRDVHVLTMFDCYLPLGWPP